MTLQNKSWDDVLVHALHVNKKDSQGSGVLGETFGKEEQANW